MTSSDIGPKPNGTLLFHLSDTLADRIVPTGNRPKFYWFNDRYHSHINGNSPSADYMYFFFVDPADTNAKLFTRHGTGDFASMWADYSQYLETRAANERQSIKKYLGPGIVCSFSELVPAVVGKFTDRFTLWAKTVDGSREATFSLIEDDKVRRFDEIPELADLLPELAYAVPLFRPTPEQVTQPSDFWAADIENAGKMWL